MLETSGRGQYAGAVLAISSTNLDLSKPHPGQRGYLEGDARFYIDDDRTPCNAGAGTEGYVNRVRRTVP